MFLSPAKLLVILVVALVVLGPDKLPKMARQIGSLWGDFRSFRERFESDVREDFPDLPSTEQSPRPCVPRSRFLDTLADAHSPEQRRRHPVRSTAPNHPTCKAMRCSRRPAPTGRPASVQAAEETPVIPGVLIADPVGSSTRSVPGGVVPDDPGMN